MHTFEIYSDSSCDLPQSIIDEYKIKIIPFYISLDHNTYLKEREDISIDEFYDKLNDKKIFPKTSTPSIADYIAKFEPALKEERDILCFTLNYKFSSSYESALNAKEFLLKKYPDRKIIIVDSTQATGAQELIIYQAIKMRESALTIEETVSKINELKKTCQIIFTVDSLEHLHKGVE